MGEILVVVLLTEAGVLLGVWLMHRAAATDRRRLHGETARALHAAARALEAAAASDRQWRRPGAQVQRLQDSVVRLHTRIETSIAEVAGLERDIRDRLDQVIEMDVRDRLDDGTGHL